MELVWPSLHFLPSYVDALQAGWSADNVRGALAAAEELEQIKKDEALFIASMVDREAKGEPVKLPDGSEVKRLPGFRRWLWDGEFVEITTDPENVPSQRVIEANGGVLIERFVKPMQFGGTPGLRYRIELL